MEKKKERRGVFVMMVTYKRFDFFKRTVESLIPTLPSYSQIAVVDNYSQDTETEGYLRVEFVQFCDSYGVKAHALLNNRNDGWGKAMNEGLRIYRGEWENALYVLESNNDVTYELDWYEKANQIMIDHPELGLLGLNKHEAHGVRQVMPDGLVIKDDMPATAWLFGASTLPVFLPFPEHGPTNKRGGNSEDSDFVAKVQSMGWFVGGPKDDLAHHADISQPGETDGVNNAYL